ncbi:MAG: hypothetical protein LUH14_00455 [Clostridiaceae bacterium]|nr:hypothetical protein [Clostridiaceae bacterium]
MEQKYVIEGYSFSSRAEYDRALKERETIAYLRANTKTEDVKAAYKIYKTSVDKKSFQTVFGLQYMGELRKRLLTAESVTEDMLDPIPLEARSFSGASQNASSAGELDRARQQEKKYKEAYENAKAGSRIKNFLILVLVLLVAAMLVVTYKSQYSVFTYFTDYKENMREELVDEYEQWEEELQQKEEELQQKEDELQREQEEQNAE